MSDTYDIYLVVLLRRVTYSLYQVFIYVPARVLKQCNHDIIALPANEYE